MGTGIWNSWGWHWGPYERRTREILLENLVENDWKPYQEAYQQPCWEPQIRNPFTNPKNWQPSWSSKALYRNFVGKLKPRTLHWDPIGNPVGNLETPIRNLVGNLKPETRNRELIGNLVGNREESSGKLPRHAPKHLLTAEDPKL